jgi:gallate decarboxylase subunit D
MKSILIHEGEGRTRVSLNTHWIGKDLIVFIFNKFAHIGAVAVSDYCDKEDRVSTSVITRFGHKEDSIASNTAHAICKALKRPVCAIAGVHLDNITGDEIAQIIQNCDRLANACSGRLAKNSSRQALNREIS